MPVRNIKLTLSYDGSDFSGWQIQPDRPTTQGVLSQAIERITGDGSVYTSVRELSLWDKALRAHTIIGRRSQELAWTNGRYDNGNPIKDDDGDGYGFGWVTTCEVLRAEIVVACPVI